jgi:endo-1,4-beta-xylanase
MEEEQKMSDMTSKKITTCTILAGGLVLLLLVPMSLNAQLAKGKSKWLGNIIASSVPSNYATYWNQVTPENSGKWGSAEPSRDSYSWSQLDTAYNYAKQNGFPFKLHTLVWGSQEPGWIGSLSDADKKAEVEEWIRDVCQRYPNLDYIDVVNEPLHAKPSYRNAIGGDGSTGWDWVIWAFQTTRGYTNAKLLMNDYNIFYQNSATDQYITIVNLLKSRGLIDGAGEQFHSYESEPLSTLQSNLNRLGATGVPVYISEWEARGDDNTQLSIYQQQFPMLWESQYVQGITLWGYINGTMWRNEGWLVSSASGGTERPALQWIRSYLQGSATTGPTSGPTTAPTQAPGGMKGDTNGNGSVDIVDALLVAQYFVGLNPQGFIAANADTNCSGSIDIVDALLIAQKYVGLISNFPC